MAQSKDKMRILTLNAHSLLEADNNFCLDALAEAILHEEVDVIALQEVNQPFDAAAISDELLQRAHFIPIEQEIPIRCGNFALELSKRLLNRGGQYQWTWIYNHRGYGRFDEGVSIFSRLPILETESLNLSEPDAFCARATLGIRTEYGWFYSVHMGWWKDAEDPFVNQWKRLNALCHKQGGAHYLMGDFNSPAHLRGEGYDLVTSDGWIDCYLRAIEKDDGITVGGQIDGWRREKVDSMRIDFVFANVPGTTLSSRVIFNGCFHPVISDHSGVLVEEGLPE